MRVTLKEPGVAGEYVLEERLEDGRVVLRPDTSAESIERRLGVKPASQEGFERHFGLSYSVATRKTGCHNHNHEGDTHEGDPERAGGRRLLHRR